MGFLMECVMEMSAQDTAALREWERRVSAAVKGADKQAERFAEWRDAVDLRGWREADGKRKVLPYLIHSALSSLVPALYAKNPEIEIRPLQAAVAEDGVSAWAGFARTAEALLQRELVQAAELKRRMKSVLLSVLTTGYGCLKLGVQQDYRADALLRNRLPDAQDNVAALDALAADWADGGADGDWSRGQLERQTAVVEAALRGEGELYLQKGLVADTVASEDFFVLDASVRTLADYAQAGALAQRVWLSAEQYKRLFGADVPKNAVWHRDDDTKSELWLPESVVRERQDGLLEVWEVWCKDDGFVYTFAKGATQWARLPYRPQPAGERFYPFFLVMFNQTDGRFWPLSDVQTLTDYQDEYAHLRSQMRNVRQMNKPVFVVPKGGDLSAAGAQRLVERVRDDEHAVWAAADIPPNMNVNQAIQQFAPPQINQALFYPSAIFRDVEMTTRSGDAARGYINKAKTATEAEIMSLGMQSGMAERQDVLEDMMRELAQYALELMLQTYSPQEAARILGAAGSAWQNVPINTAFRYLAVEIRAGSMSKPNKFQEREQWTQLLPMVRETVAEMGQLAAAGQLPMAQVLRRMLAETLRRFDDRLDLDEFLPDMSAVLSPMAAQVPQEIFEQQEVFEPQQQEVMS